MPMKAVVFRIRRGYFNQIVAGIKKEEIRENKPFWFNRLFGADPPSVAVFICGKDVHRRWIKRIYIEDPEKVLGRPLSEQGRLDLKYNIGICGRPKCIIIELGDVYKEEE